MCPGRFRGLGTQLVGANPPPLHIVPRVLSQPPASNWSARTGRLSPGTQLVGAIEPSLHIVPRLLSQPRAPVQRRVRSVAGKTAIPADCKDFVVAGNCEVQLDDDLVVGLASMGRTQCCMMTIKWLCGEDGAECSYGAWLEERAERAGGPVEEGRACSHRRDTNASEDEQKANQNRVALLANGVKLVAYSGGQHHSVSVYQRLPGSFAMTDTDRIALFYDDTGRILCFLEADAAAHCMVAEVYGKRCPYRRSNGLPYYKRHNISGLPLMAHDDDGVTGHGDIDVWFGCGHLSDDHPSDSEEADGASTHRWGDKSCRTYIKSYHGSSKDHIMDACGRPLSSPQFYGNRAYLHHVVDSPLFDASPDGERRVETTILSVTGRIRFMHAVQKAYEHGDGGPAPSWPSVYAYMQRYHRTYLASREFSMFDQWFPRLACRVDGHARRGVSQPLRCALLKPIELLAFIERLSVVRRSFNPSAGSRKAANRRYMELGYAATTRPSR
eukprot:jgi/Tetstr1/426919/TSEL_017132.t1